MPRTVSEIRIVVASPSDMFEARNIVFEAIREIDRAFEMRRISVRGLGWEDYASPGVGESPQGVINQQVLADYDMLVALFGKTLGTPTKNSKSGTVEEIEHSLRKSDASFGMYRTQVYFRDRLDSLASASVEELCRVMEYRSELSTSGVLYKSYGTDDELRQVVRLNIERAIFGYLNGRFDEDAAQSNMVIGTTPKRAAEVEETIEAGLLDHLASAEEGLTTSLKSMQQMNAVIEEIGAQTTAQVADMERVSAPSASAREKKDVINAFAAFLKLKAGEIKREALSAKVGFENFVASLLLATAIEKDASTPSEYKESVGRLLDAADELMAQSATSKASVIEFKGTIGAIPRITIQFNQAKRLLVEALDECVGLFDAVEKSVYEMADRT